MIDPAVQATCVTPGQTAGSHCSVCGKTIIEPQYIPAMGHSIAFDQRVYEATASEELHIHYSILCGCEDIGTVTWHATIGTVHENAVDRRSVSFSSTQCGVAEVSLHSSEGFSTPAACKVVVHGVNMLKLPNALTKIDVEAFRGTFMEEVILPGSVEKIGEYAFADCIQLAVMMLPKGLTDIAGNAFDGCDKLTLLCTNEQQVIFAALHQIPYVDVREQKSMINEL